MTGWRSTTLGEICSLVTDGKHGDCRAEENSGYYFISAKDIREGRINYEGARQIVQTDFAETHRRTDLRPGDLLITNSGTIGRMAIAADDARTSRTTFQKSVAVLKPKPEDVSSRFLYYCLNTNLAGLIQPASGAAQKNLLLGDIRRFRLKKPSLTEQQRIVAAVSPYDDLIENNRRRIALVEQAARLLYEEWFVRFHFPGHEHVAFVDKLPSGWKARPLSAKVSAVMGQSPPSKFYNEDGIGLPFHQGVTDYGDRYPTHRIYCTQVVRLAEPGDILFSVRAPVGRINISRDRIVIGRGLAALRSRDGHQTMLFHQLRAHFHKEDLIGTGAIFAAVKKDDLFGVRLVSPPEPLVIEFEARASVLDRQIEVLSAQNEKLAEARDLLLPRLMSGEVEV